MGFATLGFLALSLKVARPNRTFNYIAAGITMVAAITYFSMGSSLGWAPIAVEWPAVTLVFAEITGRSSTYDISISSLRHHCYC